MMSVLGEETVENEFHEKVWTHAFKLLASLPSEFRHKPLMLNRIRKFLFDETAPMKKVCQKIKGSRGGFRVPGGLSLQENLRYFQDEGNRARHGDRALENFLRRPNGCEICVCFVAGIPGRIEGFNAPQ